MKAIIVDFDGEYVIVATPQGDFKRIYNRFEGLSIGDEIDIPRSSSSMFNLSKKMLAMVAACFLLFIIGGYSFLYLQPVTFITLDINPSVELSLNRFNRVVDVKGLNSEGAYIIGDGKAFYKKDMEEAMRRLLDRAITLDYLDYRKNTIMIAVSNINNDVPPNLPERLKTIAESELEPLTFKESDPIAIEEGKEPMANNSIEKKFVVLVENTTVEKRNAAKEADLSQGKLILFDKLKTVKPDATIKHIKDATVTDIVRELEKFEGFSPSRDSKNDKKKMREDIKDIQKAIKDELKILEKESNEANIKEDIKNIQKTVKDEFKNLEKASKEAEKKEKKDKKDQEKLLKDFKKNLEKKQKEREKLKKDLNKKTKDNKGKKERPPHSKN